MEEDLKETSTALVPLKKEEPILIRPDSSFLDRLRRKPLYLPGATQVRIGQPWTTDFSEMAHLLRMQGVPNGHLKPALAILIGLNSANLKNAIAIEIINNEERSGGKILDTSLTLVPRSFWVNFKTIPKDIFILEREQWNGKVIIARESTQYRKVADELNTLLVEQKLDSTQTIFGKYGSAPQDITVSGPVGFISITQDDENAVLNHPSFLKIQLTSGEPPQDPYLVFDPKGASEMQKDQFKTLLQRVSSSLKRLRPQPVVIPYQDILLNHLVQSKNGPKWETLLNALRIITLINHPPAQSCEEQMAKAWELDLETIQGAAGTNIFLTDPLVATKRDYYLFWVIMSDLIRTEAVSLTPIHKRILKVIKDRNLNKLGLTWVDGKTTAEKLIDISHSNGVWASMDDIMKGIEKDGGEPIGSTSTVRREVQKLLDFEEIQEGKYPAINKKGYFVTSFVSQDTVPLPHPSEIEDPVLGKEKIRVQNPITGEIEEV